MRIANKNMPTLTRKMAITKVLAGLDVAWLYFLFLTLAPACARVRALSLQPSAPRLSPPPSPFFLPPLSLCVLAHVHINTHTHATHTFSLSHLHMHAHAHAHAHILALTRTHSRPPFLPFTPHLSPAPPRLLFFLPPLSLGVLAYVRVNTHAHAHTHILSHTHSLSFSANAFARAHTHTRTCSLFLASLSFSRSHSCDRSFSLSPFSSVWLPSLFLCLANSLSLCRSLSRSLCVFLSHDCALSFLHASMIYLSSHPPPFPRACTPAHARKRT